MKSMQFRHVPVAVSLAQSDPFRTLEFGILSNFLANEKLQATFPKVSTFLATLSLFQPRSRIFEVLNVSSLVIW